MSPEQKAREMMGVNVGKTEYGGEMHEKRVRGFYQKNIGICIVRIAEMNRYRWKRR